MFTALQSGIVVAASLRSDRLAAASPLELQMKVREDSTITEKAPSRTFRLKTLLRHHKGWAGWLA